MCRVPRQVFARQLSLDEFGIFGEEKDSPLQTNHVRALLNGAVQQRVVHSLILSHVTGACDEGRRALQQQPSCGQPTGAHRKSVTIWERLWARADGEPDDIASA